MKPPMQDELEDDLAAEEENKLINEVLQPMIIIRYSEGDLIFGLQEYKTW